MKGCYLMVLCICNDTKDCVWGTVKSNLEKSGKEEGEEEKRNKQKQKQKRKQKAEDGSYKME